MSGGKLKGGCLPSRLGLDALASNLKKRQIKVTTTDKPDNDQVLRLIFDAPKENVYRFTGTKVVVYASDTTVIDESVKRLRSIIESESGQHDRLICSLDCE